MQRKLTRSKVLGFFAKQPPCLVGIEATGNAHYWARVLNALGHTPWLMPVQCVKPYVKRDKSDPNDAAGICGIIRHRHTEKIHEKKIRNNCIWVNSEFIEVPLNMMPTVLVAAIRTPRRLEGCA